LDLELIVEEPDSAGSRQDLIEALVGSQTEQYGEARYTTVGYYLRTQEGVLLAGLSARFRWGGSTLKCCATGTL
jgi:hypothetical protein